MKTKTVSRVLYAVVFVFLLLPVADALAFKLAVKNNGGKRVSFALFYYCYDRNDFVARGWWSVQPWGKSTVDINADPTSVRIHLSGVNLKQQISPVTRYVTSNKFMAYDKATNKGSKLHGDKKRKATFTSIGAKANHESFTWTFNRN